MNEDRFTCPCCGYRTFSGWPGSYEICHVCFWEDDPVQLLNPWFEGGANQPSLVAAQAMFAECGAAESRFVKEVQGVQQSDVGDAEWRPVMEQDHRFVRAPKDLTESECRDIAVWYYWKQQPECKPQIEHR